MVKPAQSVHTNSCPSQCGPAPTLIVGMRNSLVTVAAAAEAYREDVEMGVYPGPEHEYDE